MKLFQIHRNLIPLLGLAGLCIFTILIIAFDKDDSVGFSHDRVFTISHYFGCIAILLNLLVYFLRRRLFKITLVTLLSLWLFNLINFIPIKFSVWIGPIIFNPFALLFIIVYYFLNKIDANRITNRVLNYLLNSLLPSPSPLKQAENRRESIAKFKTTFARKSDESLLEIVQKRAVVPDALEAAKQLLQERGVDALNR